MNNEFKPIMGCDLRMKEIEDIKDVKKGNITYYYVKLINNGGRCPYCGEYESKVKEYRLKTIPHTKNVIIKYKARRFICKCGKTFYEEDPFKSKDYKLSDNAIEYILTEIKRYNHNFSEIAQSLGISVTKVIEIFDGYVQIERKKLREVISIDEFYFSKHSRSKYAFMILGLNGKVLDIRESRKKSPLLDYFKYIPIEEKLRVKYVTIDMNEVYKDVIHRRLKNATICIDSFHVIKLMNDELDRLRLKIMNRYKDIPGSEEYYLLKHHNNVLFKEELDVKYSYSKYYRQLMNDIDYLNRILKINPELTKVYQEIKRYYYFNHYWNENARDEALDFINRFINDCLLTNNSI